MAAPPQVGRKAPDFELRSLSGKTVRLSETLNDGRVALLVLRGFPGYQCPLCQRQVRDYVKNASGFSKAGVRVVMVYPGPAQELPKRAQEFAADKDLPPHFEMLLDPDYRFTNLYGLRWNAPGETAYPATFLLNGDGTVTFAKISDSHGGRTSASEVLARLK
jgi:peroxiredoxin